MLSIQSCNLRITVFWTNYIVFIHIHKLVLINLFVKLDDANLQLGIISPVFFLSTLLLVVYNFFQYEFFCFMSFIKEKSSPLLPFRWEQLYELWLDIINLCLPFNFDYDMIFLNL